MQHVFIVGSKGIPGAYGGFETFVDKLTQYHQHRTDIKYHVACKGRNMPDREYQNARLFYVGVPKLGPAQAVLYDMAALQRCCQYIRAHHIKNPIVYVLACRIGPVMGHYVRVIHRLGGKVYINPDGHEWLRAKWGPAVRAYWRLSERLCVGHADLMVCDSKNIQAYIQKKYASLEPSTTYIAYGSETRPSALADDDPQLRQWYAQRGLTPGSYYLAVGRLVPENNYETMIREFMAAPTQKTLAIITTENKAYLEQLEKKLSFREQGRVKFVGSVYEKELLMKIRANACGYIHGHEVGGTNPSLLEALACTRLNLLLDVGFNREVAEDAALYFTKEPGSLARCIAQAEALSQPQADHLAQKAKKRVRDHYSWQFICDQYLQLFCQDQ